jgi:hypothetical protein
MPALLIGIATLADFLRQMDDTSAAGMAALYKRLALTEANGNAPGAGNG